MDIDYANAFINTFGLLPSKLHIADVQLARCHYYTYSAIFSIFLTSELFPNNFKYQHICIP